MSQYHNDVSFELLDMHPQELQILLDDSLKKQGITTPYQHKESSQYVIIRNRTELLGCYILFPLSDHCSEIHIVTSPICYGHNVEIYRQFKGWWKDNLPYTHLLALVEQNNSLADKLVRRCGGGMDPSSLIISHDGITFNVYTLIKD